MSFGFTCKGANGQTIIDENNGALMVTQEGTAGSGADGSIVIGFNAATSVSVEPPMVFANPNSPGVGLFQVYGSPGAWAYCIVSSTVANGTLNYFIAVKNTIPSNLKYGMRIFNAAGLLIYDSGYKIANFMGAVQSWAYQGRYQTGNNVWFHRFAGYYPWANGFYLVNNFGVAIAGGNGYDYTISTRGGTPTMIIDLQYVISTSQPGFGLPMVVARVTAI